MTAVARLVTLVDLDDHTPDPRGMSVSARHEAELLDGRRLLLLDDRGWSSLAVVYSIDGVPGDESRQHAAPDIWALTSVEDIEETARAVVGPDEPYDGSTREEAEVGHWNWMAEALGRQGVVADPRELSRLPHDVVLSDRLRARIGRDPGVV